MQSTGRVKVPACRTPYRPKCGELWHVAAAAPGACQCSGSHGRGVRAWIFAWTRRVLACLLQLLQSSRPPENSKMLACASHHLSLPPSSEAFQLHRIGSKAQRTGPSGWTGGLEHSKRLRDSGRVSQARAGDSFLDHQASCQARPRALRD